MTITQRAYEVDGGETCWETDWTFSSADYFDNNFHKSFIYDNPVGSVMRQKQTDDGCKNSSGQSVAHATLSNVYNHFDNYVISSGAVTYRAEFDSSVVSSSDVDAYVSWLNSQDFGCTIENTAKTSTSLQWDMVAKDVTGGSYSLMKYQLDGMFQIAIRDANTKLACLLRKNREHYDWNTASYSIRGGENLTINKSGTDCYLSFVGDTFSISGTAVADMAVKKLTSSSVTVNNIGTEARKIGVIWRD